MNSYSQIAKRFPKTAISGVYRQKGIATVLVVVLLGMSMTALSMGYMYSLQNAQEKQVAVHASTHAQVGLWSSVEAFRLFLAEADGGTLDGLEAVGSFTIDMGSDYGSISAKDIAVQKMGVKYRVSTNIVNMHSDSRSSAAVSVTYAVDPSANQETVELSAALDFYDDLNVTGGIVFDVPSGPGVTINVDGDITIQNVAISDMNSLNATGSITLNGDVDVNQVYSNGDLRLTSGATVDKAWALGDIFSDGGGTVAHQYANGNIIANASGDTAEIKARGSVSLGSASHGVVNAGGSVEVKTSGGIDDLSAVGNIDIKQWTTSESVLVKKIVGEGNIKCVANSWRRYNSVSVNGSSIDCPEGDPNLATGATNTVNVMTELTPYSMSPFVVDVRILKDKANYAFSYDEANSRMQVYVKNINGLTDDLYDIGSLAGGKVDYLCEAFTESVCTELVVPNTAVCMRYGGTGGEAADGSCISYSDGEWTFNGEGSAPGIMWFEGDINLGVGIYNSTFLVTGDVQSSGDFTGVSVNFGGFSEVCEAAGSLIDDTLIRAQYTALFENQYPTNLCNGSDYVPNPTGNIGIAAGSYLDGVYSGGDISLTAKNEVFGSILAGNYFKSSGDTTVHGYVTAAVLGTPGGGSNALGASTVIDLSDAPTERYNPKEAPSMTPPCTSNCGPAVSDKKAKVLWSRYL